MSRRQAVCLGGTHSALLRSALLPSPASSLSRELVSGRHLPLPEAVGWPRPPWLTACQVSHRHCPFYVNIPLRGKTLQGNNVAASLSDFKTREERVFPFFCSFRMYCHVKLLCSFVIDIKRGRLNAEAFDRRWSNVYN